MKKMMNSWKLKCLKRLTQILLSVSVFSFLFSQSWLVPVFLHHFDQFAPNFSIKFFTFESERNYIFLLCNGILVLIIKISGLAGNPRAKIPVDRTHVIQSQEIAEAKEKQIHEGGGGGGGDNGTREKELQGLDQTEEEEEEEIEVLSADEMNKKFDEFIKKVKQEIQNDYLHVATSG